MLFRSPVVAVALAVAFTGCVPPVPSNDIVEDHPETTAMGRIQGRGVIRIGLEADAYPVGAEGRRPAGFTYEIAAELAESLGVDVEFVAAPAPKLAELVDVARIDVAFPLTPITEAAVGEHAYSDPWWVGHQRLLARNDEITGVDDLAGRRVCDAPDPATGVPIKTLAPGAVVEKRSDPRACAPLLVRRRVGAVSGPDVLLIPLLAAVRRGSIVGERQTTAGYGALMSRDSVGLNGFVDDLLREIDAEGRWTKWYERYVSPITGEPAPTIPLMTVEEAAALYPK